MKEGAWEKNERNSKLKAERKERSAIGEGLRADGKREGRMTDG
jgi:hypothetical protein